MVQCDACDFCRETTEPDSVRTTLGQARRHARTEGHQVRCTTVRATTIEPPTRGSHNPIDYGTRRRAAADRLVTAQTAQAAQAAQPLGR